MANTARKLEVSNDTRGITDAAPQRTLFVLERETAKLEKFRLEEILAKYNEAEEETPPSSESTLQISAETMKLARVLAKRAEDEDTIDAPSPRIPPGVPSPLGDEAPVQSAAPISAYNRKFSPVPDLPLVATPATSKSRPFIAPVAPIGTAAVLAGSGSRPSANVASPNETRTRWVVVGIWATAVALAASLAVMAAHEEKSATHPVPSAVVAK